MSTRAAAPFNVGSRTPPCAAPKVPRRVSLSKTPPPAFLCFTSWWRETERGHSVRREVRLKFDTRDGSVTLCLNKVTSTQYRLSHMEGKFGPVEAIDLYVGAQLRVLGRVLTLRQADSPTVHWLEAESERLMAIQRKLLDELASYGADVRGLPSGKHACGFDGGRLRPGWARDETPNASASLRLIERDNDFLRARLRDYRPVLGEV